MKTLFSALLLFPMLAVAQPMAMQSTGSGFFVNIHGNYSQWNFSGDEFGGTGGAGVGLRLGYGFTEGVAIFLEADAAALSEEDDVSGATLDYTLGQGVLGVQYTFGSTVSKVRPYAEAGLLAIQTTVDIAGSDATFTGAGANFGGGVKYHFNLGLALDAGVRIGVGSLSEAEFLGETIEIEDGGLTSYRFNVGITWHPGQ